MIQHEVHVVELDILLENLEYGDSLRDFSSTQNPQRSIEFFITHSLKQADGLEDMETRLHVG